MNVGPSESKIVLMKDDDWSVIEGEPCRITDFKPLGSSINSNGKVQSIDKTKPYASIAIECKKLGNDVRGYIIHKKDFEHLWAAFKARKVKKDEEVIIIWSRKHYKRYVKMFSLFMPKLWVVIYTRGAYELLVESNYRPELTDEARWNMLKPIIEWKPKVME
jgi:hypothetical protein